MNELYSYSYNSMYRMERIGLCYEFCVSLDKCLHKFGVYGVEE